MHPKLIITRSHFGHLASLAAVVVVLLCSSVPTARGAAFHGTQLPWFSLQARPSNLQFSVKNHPRNNLLSLTRNTAESAQSQSITATIISCSRRRRSSSSSSSSSVLYAKKKDLKTYSARFLQDNGIRITTDEDGRVTTKMEAFNKEEEENENDNSTLFRDDVLKAEQNSSVSDQKIIESNNDAEPNVQIQNEEKTRQQNFENTNEPNDNTDVSSQDAAVNEMEQDIDAELLKDFPPPPVIQASPKLFFKKAAPKQTLQEQPATIVPRSGFNVVLTHCTADFDSLASAVGLARLWASSHDPTLRVEEREKSQEVVIDGAVDGESTTAKKDYDSTSNVPTFVVLPRGAHPGVQRFLSLHKHLFPIRSLRSLPDDLSGLNRLGLVDAQRRDRIGPAENLLQYAKRVTVVDHHIDSETDLEATDYIVDQVGSVSTIIAERLQQADLELTEAEATLLALGIHADTGSLCFDSTTPRDAIALAWVMAQGASQTAIAEHAQSSLSPEQQGVLTQALINTNSTVVHGVTLSTCLLSAEGFINGLAAVTQDALELSSSDVYLLAVVYEAQSGSKRKKSKSGKNNKKNGERLTSRLLAKYNENKSLSLKYDEVNGFNAHTSKSSSLNTSVAKTHPMHNYTAEEMAQAQTMFAEAWRGGEEALRRRRLQAAFDRNDLDASGYLEEHEIAATLAASGIIASPESIRELMEAIDTDADGKVDFEEFVNFAIDAEKRQLEEDNLTGRQRASTMIIIGRVKAGVNMKAVKLNQLLEKYGGGGHAKAASATVRLNNESEAEGVLQGLVDEVISTSLQEQPRVGDFMTAPVLSVKPDMTEKQVEDFFQRYDVRALPVVDEENEVIGLVTYKEVAAAKQRLFNKEQKRLRREKEVAEKGIEIPNDESKKAMERQKKSGTTVKGWMLQHVSLVEDTMTMSEVETMLFEDDVGCIPVVQQGTKKLVGMVTRTDLLRQHRYYPSLHYHNKGFADSISARKPIIELRKRHKQFDLENE